MKFNAISWQNWYWGFDLLKLSVLDQSPIASGSTAAEALQQSVELAQHCEALGYHRYWVAEHHGSKSFAGCSPEILVGRIAAATSHIRVGSGGVMLMHYSPLKVAENFSLLQTLFPDRIDLGIGRAPGSDGITAAALAYGSQVGIDYFPAKVADLMAFLNGEETYTEALRQVHVTPRPKTPPELWMLGSSEQSALFAAHFGLPFSFAHFISPAIAAQVLNAYRDRYKPSAAFPEAQADLSVFVLTAESTSEAEDLALSRDLWRLRVERGEFGPIPSIEEARNYPYSAVEQSLIDERREHQILGTPAEVKRQLLELAMRCSVEELTIVSITHDFNKRKEVYRLLANAFEEPETILS